ncbi:hypothetical protein BJ508DRAFT_322106 [Ascobolus immersus RN42]|uniref:Uncharacterized protein n=1 Tax=Ascobolus immersus RN42 TaxID=1160509 RepID=A0A3N4IIJ6_ASCIM|nr:hypothetical protein BJ508DRAFT_322106 [Ascobolus immersus RN42]
MTQQSNPTTPAAPQNCNAANATPTVPPVNPDANSFPDPPTSNMKAATSGQNGHETHNSAHESANVSNDAELVEEPSQAETSAEQPPFWARNPTDSWQQWMEQQIRHAGIWGGDECFDDCYTTDENYHGRSNSH